MALEAVCAAGALGEAIRAWGKAKLLARLLCDAAYLADFRVHLCLYVPWINT